MPSPRPCIDSLPVRSALLEFNALTPLPTLALARTHAGHAVVGGHSAQGGRTRPRDSDHCAYLEPLRQLDRQVVGRVANLHESHGDDAARLFGQEEGPSVRLLLPLPPHRRPRCDIVVIAIVALSLTRNRYATTRYESIRLDNLAVRITRVALARTVWAYVLTRFTRCCCCLTHHQLLC